MSTTTDYGVVCMNISAVFPYQTKPTNFLQNSSTILFRNKAIAEQSQDTKPANNKSKIALEATLAGLALIGIAGAIGAKKTKMNIFQALEKNGLEIKNGIIISSKTGENFTGTIKYNSKSYGWEKDTVSYINGKTTEFLCHSHSGKEIQGLFFKDGKPYLRVGTIVRGKHQQYYPLYTYNEKGVVISTSDCAIDKNKSVFDEVRNYINKK